MPVIPRGGRLAAPSPTAARTTPLAQQLRLSPEISSRLVKAPAPSAAPCLVLGRELPPPKPVFIYLFLKFCSEKPTAVASLDLDGCNFPSTSAFSSGFIR